MFKVESYITPIILSYVDKYIKNFRTEDSQVSLWGGDALFQNLDLRLDVLEQELQLPFNLVSGHIHELLIHVPWTKLASEPINITINTIECVLKLRESGNSTSDNSSTSRESKRKQSNRKQDIVTPSGYVQLLINKIVNNITINCNNLILKYVEEDIVVSVNIKLLTFQCANDNWQAAYTELSASQRKLITLSDLTVCIDKRNAAGKIEVYQEPVLYRCFIEMRLLRNYRNSSAEKASSTRLDIYCNKMEFSMTEQQIPMLMRMINLLLALHQRQLKNDRNFDQNQTSTDVDDGENNGNAESWAGWAWSFASNIFPSDSELGDTQFETSRDTLQLGMYIDHAILTFKVCEYYQTEKPYYTGRKLKYRPLLCLQLNGCYTDTVSVGVEWCSVQMGVADAVLLPQGCCSCSVSEIPDDAQTQYYMKTGKYSGNYKLDSLFDSDRDDSKSQRKMFIKSWDHYLSTITEDVMLEKTPAFAIDYLYHLEVPDDYSSENLSELGSDLEYSNLPEKAICRLVGGPFVVYVSSGLIHRASTLHQVMTMYDYAPYKVPPPDPELSELLPPSEDDYDALNNDIPTRIYQLTFLKPIFEFQLMDHPKFIPTKENLFRRSKKISNATSTPWPTLHCPKVTLECETVDFKLCVPMYPKRLVYTTCQLPSPPIDMFNACYSSTIVKISGVSSQMIFNSNKRTTVLIPFNMSYNYKSIIFPKYWVNPDTPHDEFTAEIDSITVTATKAKLMVIVNIIEKFIVLDPGEYRNSIFTTSLLQDASRDSGMVVLELYLEHMKWGNVCTASTIVHNISLDSLKTFVLEPNEVTGTSRQQKSLYEQNKYSRFVHDTDQTVKEPNQVLIISGPELNDTGSSSNTDESTLLTITMQYPRNIDKRVHPPLLFFNLSEIKICFDPLLFCWLLYYPKYIGMKGESMWNQAEPVTLRRTLSEMSGSLHETPRRANTPHESIHSSSDRDHKPVASHRSNIGPEPEEEDLQDVYYDLLLKWYPVWTNAIIFGDIAQCTVYFPTQSLSAVGSRGIQEAVEMSLTSNPPPEIMVLKLPNASIRSAAQRKSLIHLLNRLPIKLPENMWIANKQSFPWSISIWNFCCYTLQNESKLYFLKPVSGNATIGLSAKYKASKENIVSTKSAKGEYKLVKSTKSAETETRDTRPSFKTMDNINSLSVCVHIDNTPIEIALSEIQVCLITSILHGLYEVSSKLFPPAIREKSKLKEIDATNILGKSRSQSPTLYKEDFPDVSSERTPTSPHTEIKSIDDDLNNMKFTIWVQWTITRLRLKLYAHNVDTFGSVKMPYLLPPDMKFVFDMEDIMSSLDLQQVYMKLKSKIVTASVHHFIRKSSENNWEPGPYLGLVMRGREEFPTSEKQDDFGFMSITVTRAKCGHVHTKWGTSKKHRLAEMKIEQQLIGGTSKTRYISELVATVQPIDLVLSPNILRNFYMVLEPLSKIPTSDPTSKSTENSLMFVNNNNLPLAYLDCNGLRIVFLSSELPEIRRHHDVCIIEIESINLVPTAENPICRVPIRPDIYQHAAQTRILNVPGSEIEDRQYQLNINSLSVNTGLWSEFSLLLSRDTNILSSLHTMNENPALEWNNLEGGRNSLIPNLSLLPIIQKFNMCIVMAPAILCRRNILICGCSMEVNCVSDIEINISLYQISLISALITEFNIFNKPLIIAKRPKIVYLDRVISPRYAIAKPDSISIVEYTKDSGVECTDANSEITAKTKESVSQSGSLDTDRRNILKLHLDSKSSEISHGLKNLSSGQSCLNYCPVDILITGGQIIVSLFNVLNQDVVDDNHLLRTRKKKNNATDVSKEDTGYEASEEGSVDEISVTKPKVQPFLFILLSQPNVFFSKFAFGEKINVSCFDVCIKTNESQFSYTGGIPTQKDYSVKVLVTKTGIPNPDTGIPPAFITLKWINSIGKSPSLDVDFGRPIKICYSVAQMNHLLRIKDQLLGNFQRSFKDSELGTTSVREIYEYPRLIHTSTDTYTKFKVIRKLLWDINNLKLNFAQIVFTFQTESGPEMTISFGKLNSDLIFSNRPENISNIVAVENFTLSTNIEGSVKLLINPWSFNLDGCLFWESWQHVDSDPQMQLSMKSDCLVLDIGPEQMKCVDVVMKECNELMATLANSEVNSSVKQVPLLNTERDQHYKDDLRTGAFQFVDATVSVDEMPLPYQVMFWTQPVAAMAWRYPQPRILTKVRVFPVPFKVNHDKPEDQQVLCSLQYWSECHHRYISYATFHLSESEMYHLDLPNNDPQAAISCAWRVVLNFSGINSSDVSVSPRALAVCLRIDSYFSPVLVPRMQLALDIASINVCFYNQFNKNMAFVMPDKLRGYTPDGLVPDTQCFMMLNCQNTNLFIASWYSDNATIDFKTTSGCDILDYASLTLQPFVEPCSLSLRLNLAECLNIEALSDSINIKLNAAIGHTLAVATQVWLQNYATNTITDPPDMIILTRYVVCNDTNVKLRFGQVGTDEDILLASRFLHLYCLRSQKHQRKIKVGIEQNGWVWSEPLDIDTDRSVMIEIKADYRFILMMTVKSLSRTQKQIIFSGQLVVCNMLLDHFELKLVSLASENKDEEFRNAQSHVITGRSTAPSFVVNLNRKLALRLKFFSLESAWSGDIPLEENVKCSQPWLVKIPLQERGQFLSIWCRVVVQHVKKYPKILVMLWPLFMVRSNLPVSTKINVETPTLNVRLDTSIRGRGELQQLYCPGTIDHSHNLTFQYDAEPPGSVPFVPLNYTLIDHKQFFKRIEKENIMEMLEFLKNYDESAWPYVDSNLDRTDWIVEDQPYTHVQVRYKNACPYSSSLLVEFLPWCLLLNTLGCPIKVTLNERELCNICHHGVVTPPKLENTFNIAVNIDEKWNISPLLQLARPDWSQSFYMPKINGLIPLEGNIQVPIKCDPLVCLASLTSRIVNEIRILQVQSSHVITNYTEFQLEIISVLLPDNNRTYHIPSAASQHSITLPSHINMGNIGVPIVKWFAVDEMSDSFSDYSLHIIVSLSNDTAQTCPIRVDKTLVRKNICLYSSTKNIPLIIIAQEHKGQTFLSLHHDIHPQLLISNKCNRKIFCTECDVNGQPILENARFNWKCGVKPNTETYYTMPQVSEKFPELNDNFVGKLVFAVESEDTNQNIEWSHTININNYNEQYLRIPEYEDVKLSIKKLSHTVLITIDSATRAEISARDIRRRLFLQSSKYTPNTNASTSTQKPVISLSSDKIEQSTKNANQKEFDMSDRQSASDCQVVSRSKKISDENNTALSEYSQARKKDRNSLNVAILVKNIIATLTVDNESNRFEQMEVTTLACDGVAFTLEKHDKMDCCISITDIQCDNQLFRSGFYDFPVVLVGVNPSSSSSRTNPNNKTVLKLIEEARSNSLIQTDLHIEVWTDNITNKKISEIREVKVSVRPLLAYIEDTYVTKLMDYISDLFPTQLVMWTRPKQPKTLNPNSNIVGIPEHLSWESRMLAKPLILRSLSIEPVSVLLSVHSSVKLYIALDRSPLYFSRFERKNLTTTPYRLGHALTMHYLSGAIFGAGWVVGSLELLGSPSGLARTLGTGLRDFVSLPYHGLIQGPWAFLIGITHGSASLMRHITAGTLDSFTKLAASVARNLDRLTLDEEHQRRTEELRRQRPQGLAQGFMQGLTGLGISLLGAVGGIAHHPLQSMMNDGASPRGLATGVGLGLVGVITKPLSGAAELLALTGQGLLQGAGWNPMPTPRINDFVQDGNSLRNSILKYKWKFLQNITLQTNLLAVIEAVYNSNRVMVILTFEALIIIDIDEDVVMRVVSFNEITGVDVTDDNTKLCVTLVQPVRPVNQNVDPCDIEMDPVCRARVADYVKNASGLVQISSLGSTSNHSDIDVSPIPSQTSTPLQYSTVQPSITFIVNPQSRKYFCNILTLVQQQSQDNIFKVL